jgi:hypothetical protein
MDKEKLIYNIVYLPEIYVEQDLSLIDYLQNIGYYNHFKRVSEKDILNFLVANPDCIELWLQYTKDLRTNVAWVFYKTEDETYKVAHMMGHEMVEEYEFEDALKACAFYIIREVEGIRMHFVSIKYRSLTKREEAIFHSLLKESFPGRDAIVEQLKKCKANVIDENGSLLLKTESKVVAEVKMRIPIEAKVKDEDGISIHVMLHVASGYVKVLQFFKVDGGKVIREVKPEELEVFLPDETVQ